MPLMMPARRGQTIGAQSNLAATPSATNIAVNVAANASANTKTASPVTLIASTTVESCALIVAFANNSATAAQRNGLVDIMTGAAASEVVIAANLSNTVATALSSTGGNISFFLPIRIPAGTRISARHQNSTGSTNCQVAVFPVPMGDLPPFPVFSGCEMIGADTSTSTLTAITAGNSGAESGWTSIGSATAQTYQAVMPVMTTAANTTMTALAYHMEWGYSSTTMGERYFTTFTNETTGNLMPNGLIDYVQIPSGTQLQIQAECSGTGESVGYGLLCFY